MALTFSLVESPEETTEWIEGIRGFDFTATAQQSEPKGTWTQVGEGDLVAFECESRRSLTQLQQCKLTHFEDTNYSSAKYRALTRHKPVMPAQ